MPRQRMRFKVPDEFWNLLSKLADHAKMTWFYPENVKKVTISIEDVGSLSDAFLVENLWGFTDDECLLMYEFFTEALGKHDQFMANELCKRIRLYDREGYEE